MKDKHYIYGIEYVEKSRSHSKYSTKHLNIQRQKIFDWFN